MQEKKIIVLINLGTPNDTSLKEIKNYLREFLMDPYVIDEPFWFRWILVNLIIINFRSPNTQKAYQSIWKKKGSPLKIYTQSLAKKLEKKLKISTYWAMRYGNPSIKEVIQQIYRKTNSNQLKKKTKFIFFPLYPHWAMSTYKTIEEEIKKNWYKEQKINNLNTDKLIKIIKPVFYNNPQYIEALSKLITPYLKKKWQKIIFSYHGVPESHIKKSDPTQKHCLANEKCCDLETNLLAHSFCYRHQVIQTTKLVAEKLKLKEKNYLITFQSRLGRSPWLKPFTDATIQQLPQQGIKKIIIVCPSFICDNLETLFENGEENYKLFLQAGGESFTLVPCLNLNPTWIEFLAQEIKKS